MDETPKHENLITERFTRGSQQALDASTAATTAPCSERSSRCQAGRSARRRWTTSPRRPGFERGGTVTASPPAAPSRPSLPPSQGTPSAPICGASHRRTARYAMRRPPREAPRHLSQRPSSTIACSAMSWTGRWRCWPNGGARRSRRSSACSSWPVRPRTPHRPPVESGFSTPAARSNGGSADRTVMTRG
jgi:hypothetical protein